MSEDTIKEDTAAAEKALSKEERAAEKAKRFAEDPDSFVGVDELVAAVIRTDTGYGTFIGACTRTDLEVAQSRINWKISQAYGIMDLQKLKDTQSRIVTGPGAKGKIIT